MAVATAPRTSAKVETTEGTDVVIDTKLKNLVREWKSKDDISGLGWMKIADYVTQHDNITSKELKAALVEFRGLSDNSAKTTASQMLAIRKSEEAQELLQRALKGDRTITVYDLRSSRARSGEALEPQEKYEKRFQSLARFAYKEGLAETPKEFSAFASTVFQGILAAAEEAAAVAADTDESEEGEED